MLGLIYLYILYKHLVQAQGGRVEDELWVPLPSLGISVSIRGKKKKKEEGWATALKVCFLLYKALVHWI